MVFQLADPEENEDPFHTTLLEHEEWARLYWLRRVSKSIQRNVDTALHDAQNLGVIRLILDMTRREGTPATRPSRGSRTRSADVMLRAIYDLHGQNPHTDRDDLLSIENITLYTNESPVNESEFQGMTDTITFSLNSDIVYTTQTDVNMAAFEEVIDDICDAIWHPDLLRPKVEPPYLAPLTKEGLLSRAKGHLLNMPPEVLSKIQAELFIDMHIIVQKKKYFFHESDRLQTTVLNLAEWKAALGMRQVCHQMQLIFDDALPRAKREGSIRLILDMKAHKQRAIKPVPNNPLYRGVPMRVLTTFPEIDVQCPYLFGTESPGLEHEAVLQDVTAVFALHPSRSAAQHPTHDVLLSLKGKIIRSTASEHSRTAFNFAIQSVLYAITHPDVAAKQYVPYLSPLTSSGLYKLGRLFTKHVGELVESHYKVIHPVADVSLKVASHTTTMHHLEVLSYMEATGALLARDNPGSADIAEAENKRKTKAEAEVKEEEVKAKEEKVKQDEWMRMHDCEKLGCKKTHDVDDLPPFSSRHNWLWND
ncbi:hypothetical protein TI39_contig4202g00054 [Zymoseptoria brevis]|uniref:Uncharacterized protein n=1 Tax=Zymoseptoria brevis TaxID=1047168 RepID=A0A0F4GDQ5_9PEZI|nr:hypothetical protein TI39_contig4202g00054 [Zymoseptoria brevis]